MDNNEKFNYFTESFVHFRIITTPLLKTGPYFPQFYRLSITVHTQRERLYFQDAVSGRYQTRILIDIPPNTLQWYQQVETATQHSLSNTLPTTSKRMCRNISAHVTSSISVRYKL